MIFTNLSTLVKLQGNRPSRPLLLLPSDSLHILQQPRSSVRRYPPLQFIDNLQSCAANHWLMPAHCHCGSLPRRSANCKPCLPTTMATATAIAALAACVCVEDKCRLLMDLLFLLLRIAVGLARYNNSPGKKVRIWALMGSQDGHHRAEQDGSTAWTTTQALCSSKQEATIHGHGHQPRTVL